MKVSDYIVSYLEKNEVKDVFLLAGGGFMHILDSLAQNPNINKYYNLHEQASGFCADGYSLYTGKIGVCFVTTGPGATNAVTSVLSSYIDSTPIIYISGQVKTSSISTIPGIRQTGAQEADIVSIVKSVTKYAVTITKKEDIRYHLEKAFFLAKHNRPGPVWLDIPLDIQSSQLDDEQLLDKKQSLKTFDPIAKGFTSAPEPDSKIISEICRKLKQAKRPVIMAGSGIRLAHAEKAFLQMVRKLQIPVVSSRRVRDLLRNDDDALYFGCVGSNPNRYANYILQNSDFMLSIGSGLRYYLTAYNDAGFAPKAVRIAVNIHEAELEKLQMKDMIKVVSDAKYFIEAINEAISPDTDDHQQKNSQTNKTQWLNYCNKMKQTYQDRFEYKPKNSDIVNPFMASNYIYQYMYDTDILVTSPSSFAYVFNPSLVRGSQRIISHIGLGAMGTTLPEAIGACVASGKRRTIACEGDGSLQHNIQELAMLTQYNLPIKLFVDSNQGYRQIYTMQSAHFNNRHAGCTPKSGISFPNLELIAKAYGLNFIKIDNGNDMEKKIKEALSDNEPTIIEMITTMDTEYLPVVKSKMNPDGSMQTPSLEMLYPFLPDAEHQENMEISKEDLI